MPTVAALRVQIEAALANRIPSALTPIPRIIRHVAPTGIRNVDEFLQGGFPSGAITEIVGSECSGRTSLALSFIAAMTRADKVCAWVDVSDTLHPESAAPGIDLRRLLWVRCGIPPTTDARTSTRNTFTVPEKYFIPKPIKQGLHGGGFGPHPRGEVKGLSSAISDLLRPQQVEPQDAAPQRKPKTGEAIMERGIAQPYKSNKKMLLPAKPWSRLDQALRVTDLLLQNGGFGAIVLDMGSLAPEQILRIPLATWFRYRTVAEQKQTTILLLTQYACAKSSAGLTLQLQSGSAVQEETTVFTGIEHCVEVARERFPESAANVIPLRKPPQKQRFARWQSRTVWTSR
jgi:recombination protein RecA